MVETASGGQRDLLAGIDLQDVLGQGLVSGPGTVIFCMNFLFVVQTM